MTNSEYTAIKIVVDRSGSMEAIRSEAEGALNNFVKSQVSEPGIATVSLVQFDNFYEEVYKSTPVGDVQDYTLLPRGMTALNDAMGNAIIEFGEELAALDEADRPAHVIFIVVTDGLENASHEFTVGAVKRLVQQQENDYGWKFIFLAANQDAVLTGRGYGLRTNSSVTFNANKASVLASGEFLTRYAGATRAGVDYQVTPEDRDATRQ